MLAKKANPKQQNKIYMSAEKPQIEVKKFWKFNNYLNKDNKKEADLLLYGVIGEDGFWGEVTAKDFAEDLKEVEDAETINVRINSPGGDVFAGQAIYSMLKRCKSNINVYVDGLAASIASLVAMAGDKVIMPKNAMMMIHKPWTFTAGNANDMRETAETLDKVEKSILVAYTDKTGLSEDEITALLEAETWLTATEAKEKGFCDEIEETEIKASLKDGFLTINNQKFNIKNYKNFNASWYDKGQKDDGQGETPAVQDVPKVQNTFITVVQNNKMKGNVNMNLKKLCAACGLDYDALIKAGMTDDQIKAMVSAQMKSEDKEDDGKEQEDAQNQIKAEKQRVKDLVELGKTYNASEKAMQYIADGKSVEAFKDELLKGIESKEQKPLNTSSFGIGMSLKDAQAFSFTNLINALANPSDSQAQKMAENEFKVCSEAAEKYGVKNNGTVIPVEALLAPVVKNLSTAEGGALIATELKTDSFIDLLRNKCVLMQLARKLTGLVGNVDIPKQTAGTAGSWVGEDTAAEQTNPTFGNLQLRMKTVTANSYVTRKMLKQSSLDIENLIREDLALALAIAIDKAGFYGTGSDNQPKGIVNTDGVNTVTYTGDFPAYTDFVKMETEIATDNADVASMAYIVNAKTRGNCKTTQKFPTNNDGGGVIWENGNTINGYKAICTNQINDGDAILGNFADFILGMFGGLEILVDPFSESTKGGVRLTVFQDIDFGARHEESFCVAKKAG